MDSKKKSIVKTITWRIVSFSIHSIVAYFYTKSVTDALGLVVMANVFAMIIYYIHERIWEKHKEKNREKKDSKKKSLMKTITWRIIAITIGLSVAYFYTKSVTDSIGLVIIVNIVSTVLYYYHERTWVWCEKEKEKKIIEMKRKVETIA